MKVTVGISNRHVHLNEKDYKLLFGDMPFEVRNELKQPGMFASTLTVSITGSKRTIDNVRVLGPLRSYTQVEISKTDSFSLGVNPPVRNSGDLEGAAVVTIIGPNGEVTKPCCIIANRHLHINRAQREQLGLMGVEKVCARVEGEKPTIFDNVFIKESEDYTLELHLDTDDGNGAMASTGDQIEIFINN